MRWLISGGCKQGKSTLAQRLAVLQGKRRAYVATMVQRDLEDEARVARHRKEREGQGFETIECASGIERVARMLPGGTSVLLDSTTALLAEEMFMGGSFDPLAGERVLKGMLRLMDAFDNLIVVSDAIYADACAYDEKTEAYRRALADIDRALAERAEGVLEMVFGQCVLYKGGAPARSLLESARAGWSA